MPAHVLFLATQRSTIVQGAVTAATPYVVATIGNVNAKIRFAREAGAAGRSTS